MSYTCYIIDDEKPSLDLLVRLVGMIEGLVCVASETNARIALDRLKSGAIKVDLVILDISMPEVNGLDLGAFIKAAKLADIIYVSAHEKFGVKSYEVSAIDYILKPASLERLQAGFEKFKEIKAGHNGKMIRLSSQFFIFEDKKGKITRIIKDDLILVEAKDDLIIFHLTTGRQTSPLALKDFVQIMGDFPFMQFHRSYIANIEKVMSIDHTNVYLPLPYKESYTMGRNYKQQFRERVMYYLGLSVNDKKNAS